MSGQDQRSRPEGDRPKRGRILLLAVPCALLVACALGSPTGGNTDESASALEAYLASAAHLSDAQRDRMRRHLPFEGMTLQEATLSMKPLEEEITLGEKVRQATFRGRGGMAYRLVFEGSPERVIDWVVADDVVLPEPDVFRPQPPIP